MTIECPNCQEECLSREEPIPPEGLEIECPHCHFCFTMRDYDAGEAAGAPSPPPPDPSGARLEPAGSPPPKAVPPPPANPRRIPFWMVQAYETRHWAPALRRGEGGRPPPENSPSAAHPPEEIPLLVDDSVYETGDSPPTDSFLADPFPAHGRKGGSAAPKQRRSGRRIAALVLLILAACLLALALWRPGFRAIMEKAGGIVRTLVSWLPSSEDEEGGLNFSDYQSEFVKRISGGGSLFVIEGKVTNNHAKPCHSIRVKGVLFDERGQRSDEESAYCGNILPRQDLAAASEETIRKRLQNPVGSNLSNLSIAPGQSVPFMLVFFGPPEKLSEFSIEIAGYNLQETMEEPPAQ